MKNYVQLFTKTDAPGGMVASFTVVESAAEADEVASSGGWTDPTPTRPFYFLLNKYTVCNWIRVGTALLQFDSGVIIPSRGWYTDDVDEAKAFNVNDPVFSTDVTDPKSVRAREIAEKRVGVIGKTKVGTFESTVAQALALTVNTLYLYPITTIEHTVGDFVKAILNLLWVGKITADEAMARYEKIVARFPGIFT